MPKKRQLKHLKYFVYIITLTSVLNIFHNELIESKKLFSKLFLNMQLITIMYL